AAEREAGLHRDAADRHVEVRARHVEADDAAGQRAAVESEHLLHRFPVRRSPRGSRQTNRNDHVLLLCALSRRRLTWSHWMFWNKALFSWCETISFMESSLRRRGEVVELDDRVGLGPDAELARVLESVVVRVDDL